MHTQNYQDILALIQTPTRYAGNEINAIKKDPEQMELNFALVFPDLYEIGTSHFGLQILYSILNTRDTIAAERFFAPAPDMENFLRQKNIPCLSMETQRELKRFDVIGFSLLYELNFTNILTILDLSGIPFSAAQRDDTFPLILGGGPCAFNPEPLADIFDAFVIGDGEQVVLQISDTVIDFKKKGDGKKKTLLRRLSKIDGVYVPSFFDVEYDENGIQKLTPQFEDYKTVKRAFLSQLTNAQFPKAPIIPFGKPVHDRLRLEIARGCSRGCRFCQAGMIYRPVRERSVSDLVEIAKTSITNTGYSDISLLSLSTGDYSNLSQLMTQLIQNSQNHCNAISLPSVRAEKLTPELMNIIKKVRKTGFTIAPEAGSQRLRDIINKNLTQESIVSTVENALNLGWKTIKLYFMMGLPFETPEDIQAICTLSEKLAGFAKGKKNINVSITSFIPKSHTPFQRHAQMSLKETKEKLQYLKDTLRNRKIKLKWQDPEMSLIEGVFARGDRKLSSLLIAAYKNGCRLDGWTDKFDFSKWQNAFEHTGIDPLFYTTRKRSEGETLPWDHIDSGVLPAFFKKEFKKAEDCILTPDCRENDCAGCGVCDFKTLKPILHPEITDPLKTGTDPLFESTPLADDAYKKFELSYSKLDNARFFGHLELAIIVERAIKRAGLNAKYSQGFNPAMRLSFDNALPVGMESEHELMHIYLEKDLPPEYVLEKLNPQLPEGLLITSCSNFSKNSPPLDSISRYIIKFSEPSLDPEKINRFLNLSEFIVEDLSKKGEIRKTDIRRSVQNICLIDPCTVKISLKPYNTRNVRPTEILTRFFKLDELTIKTARIKKLRQG
ncbi:MAG: TIGR03960 family B12-binding radical SAM protein [Proteobacteria bacterium]|nr:TIGR03960 family B12-binding radical SAM protein [Pseudomonadota bacterium]MBU1386798.1 TIGR03960 family B12-binding radical SAM protein [Pseudomonadota bacterium]MBU1544742.1 TIGR03960 family B12-binding radical SAM protein [Pseudomonadota bacterium]MBU2481911.1 TIGR03960 family B12-binding radical SAM protein [Pseudomonadota bacterium]